MKMLYRNCNWNDSKTWDITHPKCWS